MIDFSQEEGYRVYRQSLLFILLAAIKNIFPGKKVTFRQSVNRSTYCMIEGVFPTEDDLTALEKSMQEMICNKLPLPTRAVSHEEARKLFLSVGDTEAAEKLDATPAKEITLLSLDGSFYSVYGKLAENAGELGAFALTIFEEGFLLRYPHPGMGEGIPPFKNGKKIIRTMNEYRALYETIGVENVFALNRLIRSDRISDSINISELMHEKHLAAIADNIRNDILNKKVILISGPSSSGKTTTAKRLLLHLRANGLTPQMISLDDYFLNRADCPLDADGKPNYEDLEALDHPLFCEHLNRLIRGESVMTPLFDFTTGRRMQEGKEIRLTERSVLLVEGIHALNRRLTYGVPQNALYRVYCSALTVLSFDRYNPISPTDTRLIRRIIRDNRTRATDARSTIAMWPSVQRGEQKNIFPYEDEADTIFNSSLSYEFAVYKKPAEALLREVLKDPEYRVTADRLLHFLSFFEPIDDAYIPPMSVLREFIGGGSLS